MASAIVMGRWVPLVSGKSRERKATEMYRQPKIMYGNAWSTVLPWILIQINNMYIYIYISNLYRICQNWCNHCSNSAWSRAEANSSRSGACGKEFDNVSVDNTTNCSSEEFSSQWKGNSNVRRICKWRILFRNLNTRKN